jgi:hypothetical protein
MKKSGSNPLYKIRMYHMLSRPEDPNGLEGWPFLMIMRYILVKKFKWRVTPTSFEEAMRSAYSSKWLEAMKDEMRSMSVNKVWDLERIPNGAKTVGYKCVYKMKCDSKGNVERFKARLVSKGFTQREEIDYNETFLPVSCKDSFRIIMALVAHYDL